MRKRIAAIAIAGSALTGGVIGLTVFGPSAVGAKTGASPTTTTATTVAPPTPGTNGAKGPGRGHGPGHGPWGDHGDRAGRASVVAKAIGISEADLLKDLRAGKTIAQIAKAHGVTNQKVIDAIVADGKTRIAAARKAGKLTQAQADKAQTELKKRATDIVNGTFPKGRGGDHRGRGFVGPLGGPHGRFGDASVAAKAIGISEADLLKDLRAGKTIAQIAKAHGVTNQKVIDAIVADGKTRIAAAVKAGKLTQAQADKAQTELTKRATDIVNGTFRKGLHDGRGEHAFGLPGHG